MGTGEAPFTKFSDEDIQNLKPAMKVGILATVTPEGLPHLTLISTLMASTPEQVVWGQFIEGSSKENVRANPKTGFLVMTLDKAFLRGKATFSHIERSGKDFDFYNGTPLFRYNAYFGIHTVYYMDLIAHSGLHPLPMNQIVFAAVQTLLARSLAGKAGKETVMNPWTKAFFAKIDNLKFLSYVGVDGYPVIIPVIQAQSRDNATLLFSLGAFGDELAAIPPYTSVAIFGMALTMEDVLVRGVFQGIRRVAGVRCGQVQVDWVYNPMPPKPMQIYPRQELLPVQDF
jgi:hypothetical protein